MLRVARLRPKSLTSSKTVASSDSGGSRPIPKAGIALGGGHRGSHGRCELAGSFIASGTKGQMLLTVTSRTSSRHRNATTCRPTGDRHTSAVRMTEHPVNVVAVGCRDGSLGRLKALDPRSELQTGYAPAAVRVCALDRGLHASLRCPLLRTR
jgi:hypothetical protein